MSSRPAQPQQTTPPAQDARPGRCRQAPTRFYAVSKRSNELTAHSYSHLYQIPTTGLRFFTVYGPWGRPDMALFLFTKAILEGNPIDVFNYGEMQRDFTYVDDIVEGIVRVVDRPPTGDSEWDGRTSGVSPAPYRVYNIGNGAPVRLMDFIEALEAELGVKAEKNMMPIQPGDVPATFADCTALEREPVTYRSGNVPIARSDTHHSEARSVSPERDDTPATAPPQTYATDSGTYPLERAANPRVCDVVPGVLRGVSGGGGPTSAPFLLM